MRIYVILTIIILLSLNGVCQENKDNKIVTASYYGFSGLVFIPTTETLSQGDWMLAYKTRPAKGNNLHLVPYSINLVFAPFKKGLEIGLTNTYIYASNREYGGVPYKGEMDTTNIILPIFPSVKYHFMPRSESNFNVSMALGIASPYGAYYTADKFFDLRFLDAKLHAGIATKLTTYHVFGGISFAFGRRTGEYKRDYPAQFCIEGAWGGSLKQLDEKEETFIAFSIRYPWTRSLIMSAFYRIDQQPAIKNGLIVEEEPTHKMGLGLNLVL